MFFETAKGIEPLYLGLQSRTSAARPRCLIEPDVGFEPTWEFSYGLQNRCNRPLCESGINYLKLIQNI